MENEWTNPTKWEKAFREMLEQMKVLKKERDAAREEVERLSTEIGKIAIMQTDVFGGGPICAMYRQALTIARKAIKVEPLVCQWERDSYLEDDIWNTGCGNAVVFCDGSPDENGYKYCHYCGKPIEFVKGGG